MAKRETCLSCGYPLRGLECNRCPECGSTFQIDTVLEDLSPQDENAVTVRSHWLYGVAGSFAVFVILVLVGVANLDDPGWRYVVLKFLVYVMPVLCGICMIGFIFGLGKSLTKPEQSGSL